MKKNEFLLGVFLSTAFILPFTSCENDDEPVVVEIPEVTEGVYVLNNGKYGSNNATLSYYDVTSKTVVSDVFSSVNGRKLGDTAQDMLIYGSKMYVAMYGSKQIEVMDKQGKSLKTLTSKNADNSLHQPRCFTSANGKVYVSFFDGYVGVIDTTSLEIGTIVPVGLNPEQLTVANNKVYVAVSEGLNYPNTGTKVAVLNASTLAEVTKIDVVKNPINVLSDSQGDVYVISMGDYGTTANNTLQRIDKQTQAVTTVMDATIMTICNDTIYAIYTQWNQPTVSYIKYDAKNEKLISNNFITDGTKLTNGPACIKVDPVTGNIYIGDSDYQTNGDMYIFSREGKLINKFEVGLNPVGAFFISNK